MTSPSSIAGTRREDSLDDTPGEALKLRDCAPALLILVAGLLGLGWATVKPSDSSEAYAVWVPPWSSAAQAVQTVSAAGGQLVQVNASATLVTAVSSEPGFESALYREGAWLVVDPVGQWGCSPKTSEGVEQ